jgi:drug/metabolite transporter (DMT)-like permease
MLSVAAGVSIFTVNDVIMKSLSGIYPVHQIVFVRCAVALPFLLIAALVEGRGALALRHPWLHLGRGLALYLSYTSYYLAMARLQIAETVSLFYAVPLFVAILSIPVLGERVEPRAWAAIGAGLAGVLIILRPGLGLVDPAALLALLSALAYAVSVLFARRLGATNTASTMALSATMLYALASALTGLALAGAAPASDAHSSVRFLLLPWLWPSATGFALMGTCGIVAAIGFFLLSQGYRLAEANRAAPFEYASLPWSVLWGYLFFANLPDPATVLGALIIVGGGLYTLGQERLRKEPTAAPAS